MSGGESGERPRPAAGISRGAAYEGALEAVFAILIATGLGYWADRKLDTAPVAMIVGAVIGFCAFVLRLMRLRPPPEPSPSDAGGSEDSAPRDSRQE